MDRINYSPLLEWVNCTHSSSHDCNRRFGSYAPPLFSWKNATQWWSACLSDLDSLPDVTSVRFFSNSDVWSRYRSNNLDLSRLFFFIGPFPFTCIISSFPISWSSEEVFEVKFFVPSFFVFLQWIQAPPVKYNNFLCKNHNLKICYF